jgi:ankyrin repeat protein
LSVLKSDLKLVEDFMNENGPDIVNEKDPDGFTPMHYVFLILFPIVSF